MLDACPLMMSRSGLISKWSRPIPPCWAARQIGVLIRNPIGSKRRNDCTSVTIEGVSLLLDHSGCRMPSLGFMLEGICRRP